MTDFPLIEKEITVPVPPSRAFEVFTADIARWWPVASHSVSSATGDRPQDVVFETHVGGHIYEALPDGTQSIWGRVTECTPGSRLAFTWHPGRPSDQGTRVTIDFAATGSGATRVTLVHAGWEALGDADEIWPGYQTGWDHVLGTAYAEAAQS